MRVRDRMHLRNREEGQRRVRRVCENNHLVTGTRSGQNRDLLASICCSGGARHTHILHAVVVESLALHTVLGSANGALFKLERFPIIVPLKKGEGIEFLRKDYRQVRGERHPSLQGGRSVFQPMNFSGSKPLHCWWITSIDRCQRYLPKQPTFPWYSHCTSRQART